MVQFQKEWKWYEFLHGKKRAIDYSRVARKERDLVRRSKNNHHILRVKRIIGEYNSEISEMLRILERDYADSIRKYNFPLKGLLQIIYPEFIKCAKY